ncbi:MAG: hypothetical protein GY708_21020 [Actinomycetia bacterium]|nr:hypothetical protein [Actinomycetes bacterium]
MTTSPFTPPADARLGSPAGSADTRSFVSHFQASPAAPSATAVHAAVTDDGTEQTITTAITDPDVARVISATAGGTAGDIKAIQVTVNGTDTAGATITEDLPAFTVNTAGIVTGSKAFASVSSVVIPAHDGTGATTAVGTGAALGLAHRLPANSVLPGMSVFDGTRESTDPTVSVSATVLASNTVAFDSTLDGSQVDAFYFVDGGQ